MPKRSERGLQLTAATLLAAPAALAFFSGGFFAPAQRWATGGAWLLLAVAAALTPRERRPGDRTAAVAVVALAAFAGWTALSAGWAPAAAHPADPRRLALLYLPGLAAAVLVFRGAAARRLVEPLSAAGTTLVIGYALAGRIVPGIAVLSNNPRAAGRLDQPLTYWNAMGALAALGLILAARVSAEGRRPAWLRAAAAAACAPLGVGVALSFSRASIAVAAFGLTLLIVLCGRGGGLRRTLGAGVAAAAGAAATLPFDGVRTLAGTLQHREAQGAAFGVLLLGVMAVAAGAALRWGGGTGRPLPLRRRHALLAAAAVMALAPYGIALTAATSQGGHDTLAVGATTTRLTETASNRRLYWAVAWRMAKAHPLRGAGAGSFAPTWLRERTVREGARNAHSLLLETAAELGLVGLALLGVLLGAVAVAARRLLRDGAAGTVGAITCVAAWLVHANLDWDWQMPALTLLAVACAGAVLGAAPAPRSPGADAPGERAA